MKIVRLPYRNSDGTITEEEFINFDGIVRLVQNVPDINTDNVRALAYAAWQQGFFTEAQYTQLCNEADRRDGRRVL